MEEAIKKYISEEKDKYNLMTSKVQELVSSILRSQGIIPHSITSRVKDPESLRQKIARAAKHYHDPLREITDLAGIRVITFFPSDIDKIVNVIEEEFQKDHENSVDKRKTSDPSIFGYASVHLVVEFTPDRVKLPEYALFKGMKCEIQVRTILQHAWAEIEHDIVYKSAEDIPFELRRRFSSLAGMLEVADREFESLRQEEKRVRDRIESTIKRDNIDIPIDLDSVRFYFERFHGEKELRPSTTRNLIALLKSTDIRTIQDLHKILTAEALSKADKYLEDEMVYLSGCSRKKRGECPLRYFIAIGRYLKMPIKEIGGFAYCRMI